MQRNFTKFSQFVLEYSELDGIWHGASEKEHEMSPEDKTKWKHEIDRDIEHANYKLALEYAKKFLTSYGTYNSAQATIVLDRTARKFNLNDAQRSDLEIHIFDWENQDNDEMRNVIESQKANLTPRNMLNFVTKIRNAGKGQVKLFNDFKSKYLKS
jgi:hypothetical protein